MASIKYLCATVQPPENDGDVATEAYTFAEGVTVAQAMTALQEDGVPVGGNFCNHSHDCCGNWYARPAVVTLEDRRVVIRQDWYQNI